MKTKKNIKQKENQGKKKVKEQFSGKNLTIFGGSGLIRRFFDRYRIKELFDSRVRVSWRRNRAYGSSGMFLSILYGMFLGYIRPYHMKVLCKDKVFQRIVGLNSFPDQSTISRFLSSMKVAIVREISYLNFDFLMKFRRRYKGYRSIILDLDSHVMPVYGKQQRAGIGYNPKKNGRRSYHPLFCFIGQTRDCIGGMLRSGKHHSSYNAVKFLKGVLNRLPSQIGKIRLRADSGFFSHEIINFLIKQGIEFYMVMPMQGWVQTKIKHIRKWHSIYGGISTGECGYIFTRDITLRMVVIREKVTKNKTIKKQLKLLDTDNTRYNYQVILTNGNKEAIDVWGFYNQRACCENFIKEGIYSFGMDKVVSHSWAGNSVWFELLMFAYNLGNIFKEVALNQKNRKNMFHTIREMLFLIPGKIVSSGREYILKLEQTWAYKGIYEKALCRIT